MARSAKKPELFPDDVLLRDHGFTVVCQWSSKCEAIWQRNGQEYKQSEAMRIARTEHNESLDKLESTYSN